MSLLNVLSENVFLKMDDLFAHQCVSRNIKFLFLSQWWNRDQLKKYQEEKLSALIRYSAEYIPYYKDLFRNLDIRPTDIKTHEDLNKIPILTKTIIKKEGINRFSSPLFSQKDILNRGSSGSTGEPLFYLITKEAYSMNIAANLRGWYWMNYRLGDKYTKLSQNARKDPIKKLQDKMTRNLYLSVNPLNEENYEYILTQIEKFQPKIIRCYPDPLLFLARYKQKRSEFNFSPEAITTTGNTLHTETRKEIETSFGCKIFDSYSCEGNSTVFECPSHSCYHSAEEYGISEIIDSNGNRITRGVGRLITTDLLNYAHPFIRYDTQDYVEVDDQPCACGRKLLKINRILGRDNEILEMNNSRKFIVHNFTGFFQQDIEDINRSIDQFQVIKAKNGNVIFKLVVNDRYSDKVAEYIRFYWQEELGTTVQIQLVDNIPLLPTGKRRFIFNE